MIILCYFDVLSVYLCAFFYYYTLCVRLPFRLVYNN